MNDIRQIDPETVHPAVHGLGAILALTQNGIAIALVAYSRSNGTLGGIVQTYSGVIDPRDTFDPGPILTLLAKVDWVLAHGARLVKPAVVALIPTAERIPWICSSGILERQLPKPHEENMELHEVLLRSGMGSPELFRQGLRGENTTKVPAALNQVLGLVILLTRGDPPRMVEALHRAGHSSVGRSDFPASAS